MTKGLVVFLVGTLAATIVCPGCGLLINGRSQRVTITSSPPGATIILPTIGGAVGTTPHTLRLARDQDHLIILEKQGFEAKSAYVSSRAELISIIIDILFTGELGLLVDWPLGAVYALEPSCVHIVLSEHTQ